jgi:hypothetical protein
MELPDDVISIIRDFSRPRTRHDWRTLHILPSLQFHLDFILHFNASFKPALLLFFRTQSSDFKYTLHNGTIQHIVTPDNRCYYIQN